MRGVWGCGMRCWVYVPIGGIGGYLGIVCCSSTGEDEGLWRLLDWCIFLPDGNESLKFGTLFFIVILMQLCSFSLNLSSILPFIASSFGFFFKSSWYSFKILNLSICSTTSGWMPKIYAISSTDNFLKAKHRVTQLKTYSMLFPLLDWDWGSYF